MEFDGGGSTRISVDSAGFYHQRERIYLHPLIKHYSISGSDRWESDPFPKGGGTMIQNVRVWLREVTELGLLLVALAVVLQLLFGSSIPFIGGDVVGNITSLVGQLGQNGLVGLISVAIILYLFQRRPSAA